MPGQDRILAVERGEPADAVLIGAGTLRAAPGSLWTPVYIYPDAVAELAELRRHLGRSDEPRLVLLTARGEMDPHHPALEAGALVLTASLGATKLGNRLPGVFDRHRARKRCPADVRRYPLCVKSTFRPGFGRGRLARALRPGWS